MIRVFKNDATEIAYNEIKSNNEKRQDYYWIGFSDCIAGKTLNFVARPVTLPISRYEHDKWVTAKDEYQEGYNNALSGSSGDKNLIKYSKFVLNGILPTDCGVTFLYDDLLNEALINTMYKFEGENVFPNPYLDGMLAFIQNKKMNPKEFPTISIPVNYNRWLDFSSFEDDYTYGWQVAESDSSLRELRKISASLRIGDEW